MTLDPLLAAFCRAVQERREDLGLSQEELASRAGLHRTYISDIERGSRNLSLRSLTRLASALEMPVSNLIRAAEWKASSGESLEVRRSYVRDGNARQASSLTSVSANFSTNTGLMLGQRELDRQSGAGGCLLCEKHAEFLNSLARDIKGPAVAADQALDSILSGTLGRLEEAQIKVLSNIRQNNDDLLALIHELTGGTSFHPSSLKIESCDLSALLESCVASFQPVASSQGISLTTLLPRNVGEIYADQTAMRKLFLSLLENALKLTSNGGTIEISVHCNETSTFIEIRSRGASLPIQETEAAFKSAKQRTVTCAHLHMELSVCREIVEAHGGEIRCQNADPGISVFSISLPIQAPMQ